MKGHVQRTQDTSEHLRHVQMPKTRLRDTKWDTVQLKKFGRLWIWNCLAALKAVTVLMQKIILFLVHHGRAQESVCNQLWQCITDESERKCAILFTKRWRIASSRANLNVPMASLLWIWWHQFFWFYFFLAWCCHLDEEFFSPSR